MRTSTLPFTIALISGAMMATQCTRAKDATPSNIVQPVATDGKLPTLVGADGTVDKAAYLTAAHSWGPVSIDERLGPNFEALNPGAADDRPTLYKQADHPCSISFANRSNPYQLGKTGCVTDNDYWSDSGQVAYVPDDPAHDPGLDRFQTFAYYDHVFALSPRLDYASGTPHPDPQTREAEYKKMLGHAPGHVVAMVRNYAMTQNEALVIYREGLLGVAGTQTSRGDKERPYPGLVFPPNKVPTGIAVTTENEFAVISIWDTDTQKGQLAIVAIEAKFLPYHTWKYMALPNQGTFSDFKLLGYVDLPISTPTSVAAASNGWWNGPSQTANMTLGQIDLNNANTRKGLSGTEFGWNSIIAQNGYAIVSSKAENKVVFVDLTPLFAYVRKSYLTSQENFDAAVKNRGAGPGQWPLTFAEKPEITPKVVSTFPIPSPNCVLAGLRLDFWSADRFKAYAASEDGTVHIFDASSLMPAPNRKNRGPLKEIGSIKVGKNPVTMTLTRFGAGHLPIPEANATQDALNSLFYVACRGDREVDEVCTFNGKAAIFRRIKDSRMGDPVAVSVATRGNIVSVADFNGKKVVSFRIGGIDDRYRVHYGAGEDGKADFEFAGELPLEGKPFLLNSANVN